MWRLNTLSTPDLGRHRQLDHTRAVARPGQQLEQFSYSTVPLVFHSSAATPPNYIRLLQILPSKSNGLLSCHIRTVELDSPQTPTHDALSYTWGPTTRDEIKNGINAQRHRTIICNEKRLLVTENLLSCLTQLEQDGYHYRDVWIDAICINQDNDAERCQQVSIMADIYRSAERVIVWLGTADKYTEPAWELINKLNTLRKEELPTINIRSFGNKHYNDLLGSVNSPEHWRALALLFGRSWFTRAWVVQELVLARSTVILCGKYSFDWNAIVSVSDFMAKRTSANTFQQHLFDDLDDSSLSYKNPAKLEAVKKSTLAGTSDVLLYSLIRCRTYDATKEHDKVYSLVSLANCQDQPDLYPNYEKTVARLYTDIAKYVIRSSDNLHILAHAEGGEFRQIPSLPTWVPDWSVRKDLGLRITGYKRYNAAGTLPCFKEIRRDDVLAIRGFELDTISRIGETKENVNQSRDCTDWLDIVGELEREYPGQNHKDAFWRTILIDTDPTGSVPIRQPWQNSFDVWMNIGTHNASEDEKKRAIEYETSFTHSLYLRLFRTARGHLGCGTLSCEAGDSIWIVQGSKVPLIFRPAERPGSRAFHLVGGTYVHGFMQGEALSGEPEFGEVVLV
ncbi:HET-domain-containing protein [Hypoxylon fragiforme]|uniref:HET-domain-containing protein n=1 Tax=Hypoxylon fragiforme TaxID=63214 RepID=UPI0020C65BEF|nr:HET-domain-containing protein [Hypoxylon fragiforme]KAI2606396.1 HET-domain-containing protein [Hypoxylon fragiforme]